MTSKTVLINFILFVIIGLSSCKKDDSFDINSLNQDQIALNSKVFNMKSGYYTKNYVTDEFNFPFVNNRRSYDIQIADGQYTIETIDGQQTAATLKTGDYSAFILIMLNTPDTTTIAGNYSYISEFEIYDESADVEGKHFFYHVTLSVDGNRDGSVDPDIEKEDATYLFEQGTITITGNENDFKVDLNLTSTTGETLIGCFDGPFLNYNFFNID